mmetsp:Transcript_17944/g.26630  ORF Transcript_17944/g.26630 Transcript_17944/m.26630 type:complete len:318 (-) Transcript_17944:1747-2700(-)
MIGASIIIIVIIKEAHFLFRLAKHSPLVVMLYDLEIDTDWSNCAPTEVMLWTFTATGKHHGPSMDCCLLSFVLKHQSQSQQKDDDDATVDGKTPRGTRETPLSRKRVGACVDAAQPSRWLRWRLGRASVLATSTHLAKVRHEFDIVLVLDPLHINERDGFFPRSEEDDKDGGSSQPAFWLVHRGRPPISEDIFCCSNQVDTIGCDDDQHCPLLLPPRSHSDLWPLHLPAKISLEREHAYYNDPSPCFWSIGDDDLVCSACWSVECERMDMMAIPRWLSAWYVQCCTMYLSKMHVAAKMRSTPAGVQTPIADGHHLQY